MATLDNERYLRHILLLGEGGLLVLRGIVTREAARRGHTLEHILASNRAAFRNLIQEQYIKMFPTTSTVNADVQTWDMSLLMVVVKRLFSGRSGSGRSGLSPADTSSIQTLKAYRNDIQGHPSSMNMSAIDYDTSRRLLKTALLQLASGISVDTDTEVKDIIRRTESGNIDIQSSLRHIKELHEFKTSFLDALENKLSVIETYLKNMDGNHAGRYGAIETQLQKNNAITGEMKNDIDDIKKKIDDVKAQQTKISDLHEKILKMQSVAFIRDTENALQTIIEAKCDQKQKEKDAIRLLFEFVELIQNRNDISKGEVKQLIEQRIHWYGDLCLQLVEDLLDWFDVMRKSQDAEPGIAQFGCIQMPIKCSSMKGMLKHLGYMDSDECKQRLSKISCSLSKMLGFSCCLSWTIVPDSLQKVMKTLLEKLETSDSTSETVKIVLPFQSKSLEGLTNIWTIFDGKETNRHLTKVSETLSKIVGANVNLTATLVLDQFTKAVYERSEAITSFPSVEDKTMGGNRSGRAGQSISKDQVVKVTTIKQAEDLRQFLTKDPKGKQSLVVPEGHYNGWVPRCLYEMNCANVCLPFLKLLSFPVGSSSLGNLVDMETFNAVGNYLTRLPDSFGKCQNLVRLNLSYNYLERVPSAIFQLTNLLELDLSENDLSAIHPSVGNLKRLRTLNLSGNLLEELPEELAQCEKIERLDLSRKWYPKGGFKVLPEAVCYLTELTYLDISWHQISTITEDVKNMTKLQTMRMKGNNLKHVSPAISECRKLKYLDLTGAMKLSSYVPPEIFTLPELRILDLTNNYFTEISSEIVGLKKLKKMIMRRNALLRIPDEIFQMESLESLDLSENYLEDIPHCISELKTLKNLYLACNKMKVLPEEICECKELLELQLHYNELESLPDDIFKLYQLEELTLEGNQLKTLPLKLDKLEKLKETGRLSMYNNNLQKPPQSICDQGVESLYGYLKELRICEATHRKKLILIGASLAGKSSLRNVLILGKSRLTEEHERTWVMEQHLWEPEPDLRVQILDFGGHHIYSAAYHMFMTHETLHVLVFDLSTYVQENYDLQIGDWLDSVMDRAAGATIMLVGTHADLCTAGHIQAVTNHVLDRMHQENDAKIKDLEMMLMIAQSKLTGAHKESGQKFPDLVTQRLQERVNKMQKLLTTRVKLPHKIFVVSCAATLSGIINFHDKLTDTLKTSEGQPLPTSWFKFLTAIQKRPEKTLSWSETLEIFESEIATLKQSMYLLQGSAEKQLEIVLRYLHVTGEIVWYHENPKLDNIVFHHPETLVEMLRAIFRHDFKEVVTYVDTLGQMAGLSEGQFESLKEEFLQRGLMTNELLSYCLQHFSLSLESQEIFVDLMLKFDLCYQVKDPTSAPGTLGSKQILQFPWLLTSTPPEDFATKWPEMMPINTIELRYQLQFLKKGLPNFFEKMSARLQSYVTQREDWKDGILASRNKCKLLLTRKKTSGLSCITLSVRGADLQDLWFLILTLRADMLALLQEWPFVKVDPYMVCAHCIATNTNPPYLWRGEILDAKCPKGLYETHCPKTRHSIPASLIYPIDSEFPSEDMNRHITIVTDFLRNNYDTVDSAGLLSDLVMARIAAKLGFEWNRVALELGLTQANIEQIQISHKYEGAHKMILSALLKWRDNSAGTNEEKIEILMQALRDSNRNDLADELMAQYIGS